jgi:hypothetical protein
LALGIPATAKALGLGITATKKLVSSGKLASVKIGSRRIVAVEAIRKFLARGA